MAPRSGWPRKNRVYIVPTGFGLVFIVGALVMILVGATYQNNLVNLLAFFMLSLVFIAMIQTHNNLKDVKLEQVNVDNGYAGSDFLVTAVIGNPTREPRFNIDARLRKKTPKSVYENVHPLLPEGSIKLRAAYPCGTRGEYRVRDMKMETIFPLGLFRAWMWVDTDAHYYVYPEPKGQRSFPVGVTIADPVAGAARLKGGDDYHGHRRYQPGDAATHIDWKARARGRPLLVKEFNDGAPAPIQLDWYALENVDTEERLSQLAAWVDEATRRRLVFGLRLPQLSLPPASGAQHAQRCLEALAVHGLRSEGARDASA